MREQTHWDEHTRKIVRSRLNPQAKRKFLTEQEESKLKQICSLLVGDEREEILGYVLSHIDQTLSSNVGEGQRKAHVPKAPVLVRGGLVALDQSAKEKWGRRFVELKEGEQRQLLTEVSESRAPSHSEWKGIPQREFFIKLLNLSIESYYSHPTVWSEIGYGGPAYPRGYVRTQLGQLDPWEAQPEHE
jgi:hypothetical protein